MRATKTISELTLRYLDAQRLRPSPQNYRLAFAIHERTDSELGKALDVITDGGVRVTQAQADALHERFFDGPSIDHRIPELRSNNDAIRHQALRLADLATSATAVTGEFSRELTDRLPDIATADVASLVQLVAATLERSQRAERALEATSAQVGQLREQLETVQGDAERDILTGLPNRRGIEAHLAAGPLPEPVFVALCDIDRFKSFNDRYGHIVGDRVLKTVAQSLQETLPDCFVGRWGGEEFLVIGTSPIGEAVESLKMAKAALGNRVFKLRETDQPLERITFSGGVTTMSQDENLIVVVERADALLYQAKDQGRNKVLGV